MIFRPLCPPILRWLRFLLGSFSSARPARASIRQKVNLHSIVVVAISGILSGGVGVYGENEKAPRAVIDVVKEGKPQTSIVIPDSPLPVVAYAAQELQYHIERASGAVVPIVSEDKVKGSPTTEGTGLIYLGACRRSLENGLNPTDFAANGFVIKTIGPDLFIAGNDTPGEVLGYTKTRVGTLFGVYEFLEKQMGVKWLWPGKLGEVIPAAGTIAVPQWNQTEAPRILHNRWREATEVPGEGWSSFQARERYIKDERIWLKRQRFTVAVPMDIHHAFTKYWERFGKAHPEYFNLLPDGRRRPEGAPVYVSMCVSQPALWKQIVADWKGKVWPQNQPWIDASENDVTGKCTCQVCMSWDVPDPELKGAWNDRLAAAATAFKKGDPQWNTRLGRLSDRYARFYLEVQKEAEKVDPKAVVMGLAYANYWQPPLETKLNDRIVIALVPAFSFPWTDQTERTFEKQWKDWAATGASLLLRPNYMLSGHSFPIFFADKLGKQIAFTMNHGLIGTDFDSLTGQWGTQGPNLYMLPRIIHHPDQPVEEVLDEYYNAFGPAKKEVKAYFEHWKAVSNDVTTKSFKEAGGSWEFYHMAHKIFTPEVMEKGFELLAQARKAAEGDDTAFNRVIFLEKGLKNAQLAIQAQLGYENYKKSGNLEGFRDGIKALDKFREDSEPDNIANMGFYRFVERWRWPRSILNLQLGRSLGHEWKFSWDPEKQGERAGWEKDEFDDSAWKNNFVTSSWTETEIGREWKDKHGNSDYEGVAWYRTAFTLARPKAPRRYFLVFGGVHGPCKVWVNGKLVLEHPCPDTNALRKAFQVEITSAARFDKPNIVAVRAESSFGAGGIYRPVGIYETEAADLEEKNLIQNPGFESMDGEAAGAWKESRMSGECELSIDDKERFSGESSARISCLETDAATKKSWARWYQTFPVQKDKTYRLRLYVKTSPDFNASVHIWVRSGTEGPQRTASLLSSTAGLWQQIVIKDIKPQGEDAALYLNLTDGTGSAWFDEVEFAESDTPPVAP